MRSMGPVQSARASGSRPASSKESKALRVAAGEPGGGGGSTTGLTAQGAAAEGAARRTGAEAGAGAAPGGTGAIRADSASRRKREGRLRGGPPHPILIRERIGIDSA